MARFLSEVPDAPISGPLPWIFRFAFAGALTVGGVVAFFFVWGLLDGSVSSFNLGLWLTVLALVTAIPVAGWHLRARGRLGPAILVLSILVVPGLLYALFILLVVISGTSWN